MTDLRGRWAARQPAHGVWSLLPGAVTGELLAGTGADYVVFDLPHGAVSEADLPGVTAAVDTTLLADRVRSELAVAWAR